MRWPRLPTLPTHLVHHALTGTVTVLAWLLLGFVTTGIGGWVASRATTGRRVSAGIALTLSGVIVFASAIWYHRSMPS